MKKYFLFCLLLINLSGLAQIRGVVKDSLSGLPVPYATILVENENFGSNSEENGEFSISVSQKSRNLIFSALGYERKIVGISQAAEVKLKPTAFELDEVVISKRRQTRQKEIGKSENQIHEAFENAPRIDIKFFPYAPDYKKTPFIKQVAVVTDSKIDGAAFKIHIYAVGANCLPAAELLEKDLIVSVDKGVLKTKFNLSKFSLQMPKTGIFIGFERLLIEKNKVEKIILDPNTNAEQRQIKYYPLMLYESVLRDSQFTYTNGQWLRNNSQSQEQATKIKIYEPAITLILTN